jgi:GNAT superfamily N-acetyltransferase
VTALELTPVVTRQEREAFIALPYALHRADPCWVPMLRRDARALLSRRRNAFFEHAQADYFLARRGERVVGRVAAIHNRRHNETHGDRVGFFGFFECADDPQAARALLDAAALWARGRGLDALRGPASFSINDEVGLLVEGFDAPPTLMMPHNPPRYVALLEDAGFRRVKNLFAYECRVGAVPPRLGDVERVLGRRYGVRVRPLDLRRFAAELAHVKRLYNAAWERNWGFVPLSEAEIDQLARQLRPVVVPELALFAERDGRPIGMAVVLPDFNVALRANPSGRLVPGILRVLWRARRIERVRVLILGVLPEWRGKGIDALLHARLWAHAAARGVRWAEAGWILEDNHAMRNALTRLGFSGYKTYAMYERAL